MRTGARLGAISACGVLVVLALLGSDGWRHANAEPPSLPAAADPAPTPPVVGAPTAVKPDVAIVPPIRRVAPPPPPKLSFTPPRVKAKPALRAAKALAAKAGKGAVATGTTAKAPTALGAAPATAVPPACPAGLAIDPRTKRCAATAARRPPAGAAAVAPAAPAPASK